MASTVQPIDHPTPILPSSAPLASSGTHVSAIVIPSTPFDSSSQPNPSFADGQAGSDTPVPARPLQPIDVGRREAREEWDNHVAGRKQRWRALGFNEHHQDDLEGVALSHRIALYQDQLDVLYPAAPTAFTSTEDAVQRLLPYHIYQLWDSELNKTGADVPSEHAAEKQQIESGLAASIDKISERYFKIRRREGTHSSHLPALINMIRDSTQALNVELAKVQAQHRSAQAEWNIIETRRNVVARKEAADKAAADAAAKRHTDLARAEEEKKRLEQQQLLKKHQEQQAALFAKNNAKAKTASLTNSATPTASALATPNTKAKADGTPSGRPRGRPKKVDPREQVPTGAAVTNTPPATPAANGSGTVPSVPSTPLAPNGAGTTSTNTPSTPASATDASAAMGAPKGPISISVPIPLVSHFVSLGILKIPSDRNSPTPGTILRTTADKKNAIISIRLSSCTKTQLQGMAKALNVKINTTPESSAPAPGGVPKPSESPTVPSGQ